MGGREAIRGFAVQTMLALLDALNQKNDDWIAVTVEPDSKNDKVDILWEHAGRVRAQQVKSSKNQMSKGDVEGWCRDLSASQSADEYELLLAGPTSQGVIEDGPFHGVTVPMPMALDTLALSEQASTRLDAYLSRKGIPGVPHAVRSDMVELLAQRIIDGSIRAQRHTRQEVDGMLLGWVLAAYPQAIAQKLETNCEVLWSRMAIDAQARLADRAFALTVPVTVVNGGLGVAIVEWIIMKIVGPDGEMRYDPSELSEFAVLPASAVTLSLKLLPTDESGYHNDTWSLGDYTFELFIKQRGAAARSVKTVPVKIEEKHQAAHSGKTVHIGILHIEIA